MRVLLLILVAALATAVSHAKAHEQVTVFAAASTSRAVDEALSAFHTETGIDAVASYASSGTLARQIENGAPAGVYVSANPRWMRHLTEAGLIQTSDVQNVARNSLVLIAPSGTSEPHIDLAAKALGERLEGERFAMSDYQHAPVGRYGKDALTALGLWKTVSERLAPTQNTTATVMMVSRGEAALGLVYRTDAMGAPGVTIVAEIPATAHDQIVYPIAPLAVASSRPGAASLVAFLTSERGRRIFERYGFSPPGVAPSMGAVR